MKILLLILFPLFSFSQELIILDKTELNAMQRANEYGGYIIPINQNNVLRVRIYSNRYIQTTLIHIENKYNVRIYVYWRIRSLKLTPAISLRIKI